jgi:ABC-type antimicrobial peptide transport system permease subunit
MIHRLLSPRSGTLLGAIAVIGVGVGLAAMVFALADPYALRDLPYADPGRLVSIEFSFGDPRVAQQASQADVPSLASWRARTDLFEGVAAFDDVDWVRVRVGDRVVPLRAVAATDNLFEVLGLQQRSAVDPSESHISIRFARQLSPGRSVPVVPSGTLRIGGVLPRSFLLPQANRTEPVDVLTHLPPGPVMTIRPGARSAPKLVAKLRPAVTHSMVEDALGPGIAAVGSTLSVVPLQAMMAGRQQALARGALLASALVIVVCWMNVFNIALTRGLYRQVEFATRTALGASRAQLFGLVVADGLRVATIGSAAALAVTWMSLTSAVRVLPAEFATLGAPSVTLRVIVLVSIAGAIAWLVWCLASMTAWRFAAQRHPRQIISRDGRTIGLMRFWIIAGQVGVASLLLAAAALLGRSYINLLIVDAGMDERAQTITVAHDPNLPQSVRAEVVERSVTALRRIEGVQAVGVKSSGMLNGRADFGGAIIDGQFVIVDWTRVDPRYLEAAGIQFLLGGLPEREQTGAVVTETLARNHYPGRSPLGAELVAGGRPVPIVGVVRDVRTIGLSVAPRLVVYEVGTTWRSSRAATFTYVLRVADGLRRVEPLPHIHSVDPLAVVVGDGTIGERLAKSVRDRTFATLVVGLFATASVLVIAIGLAGIVAYTVVKRTREIAVRVALGATRPRVIWLVVRGALLAALSGAVGGIIASVWLSASLERLVYGVQAADPATHLLAAAGLLVIVAGAAMLPAIRTDRIAPATALRTE